MIQDVFCDEVLVCDETLLCGEGIRVTAVADSTIALHPVVVYAATYPGVYPSGGTFFPGVSTYPGASVYPSGGATFPGRGNEMSLIATQPRVLTLVAA